MMPDNNWYGHRHVLSKYCDLSDRPSFSSIQHGWTVDAYSGLIGNRSFSFYPYLCWTKKVEEILIKQGIKNVISIGSPFLYLHELNRSLTKPYSKGTIYFTSHNTPDFKSVTTNHLEIIELIESSCEPPFTASVYWSDLNTRIQNLYEERGWRVICCGTRSSKDTLSNVYNEINSHSTMAVTEIQSSLFYAMFLKKKTKLIKNNKSLQIGDRENLRLRYKNYEYEFIKKYPDIIEKFLNPDQGYLIAQNELGFESLKTQNELKNILGWDSFLKQTYANFFSFLHDLKYGIKVREGTKEMPWK